MDKYGYKERGLSSRIICGLATVALVLLLMHVVGQEITGECITDAVFASIMIWFWPGADRVWRSKNND